MNPSPNNEYSTGAAHGTASQPATATDNVDSDSLREKTIVELDSIPSLGDEYRRALRGLLPPVPFLSNRSSSGKNSVTTAPSRVFRVKGVTIDAANLAEYCTACGLRISNTVPLTFPYAVTFPLVMRAMNSPDFPFPAVGTIHIRNVIEQYSPITVTDTIDVTVYMESLRRHRQGLLIDIITEVRRSSAPDDVIWRQRSTMLSKGKAPKAQLPDDNYERMAVDLPEDPTTIIRVSASDIKNYANVSGDKNPIHVSRLGAKAFGFPATIAHGMWSAASLLGIVEGEVPSRARYTVEFGKPIILPAVLAAYASRHPQNDSTEVSWDLCYCSAKDSSKINVTAQLAEI
ncbi:MULTISPECIES: MaoC/PaaZ C-terminal domain-containing protein [Corynebacterium]|uniref:MaoC/PaaZ C-terminal domain-containing protein n=1 Tax=Corynebacterium TaxID=1716 RepID=UPI00195C5A60|nr:MULTISPECIES: MaoC/PaaZ C-terminal domain-containing protein [Corynebacterium]MDN8624994.1 MaoC/PaaZ C-terminal domain-containing protein [Corynebacterium kroppenstedtii]QRQ64761.1 hypothetical protein I6J23_09565 [Corynebacterium kroppenstedtii]